MIADVELVGRTRSGDRAAFGELVGRHQAAVCGVAYALLGDVGGSEDVAQEAFVAAWRQLGELRELSKFKSWVCGIARNLALASVRRQEKSKPIKDANHLPANGPTPAEQAISREEQGLVWAALSGLPETYREPLVLFYRDGETVAGVSSALDLTEAAVKQRLTRGREMLRADLAATIESALRRSAPGAAFTTAVLAALPGIGAASASAATVGGVAKGAVPVAKVAASVGASAVGGALMGILGAALGAWCSWQTARYQRERDLYRRALFIYAIALAFFIAPFAALGLGWWNVRAVGQAAYLAWFGAWMVGFLTFSGLWTWLLIRRERQIVAEETAAGSPQLPQTRLKERQSRWEGRQWTSSTRLLGLPLVEIRFSSPQLPGGDVLAIQQRQVARGWIALGERAYGVIFAMGNVAVGTIAVGGVFSVGLVALGCISVGIVALGAASVGIIGIGGLGTGIFAFGGMALGWFALGGGAAAWRAAKGGVAWAHDFALGSSAAAAHANDQAARDFIEQWWFFGAGDRVAVALGQLPGWAPLVICALIASACWALWPVAYCRRRPPG
ncbi:MAG TPA: sigma-70 family RNA polymerase sigma factor [Pirellulales bacterium]|nr:sigma-70 family RNA polymerase sigma factor [Pirellulales bacterium]